MNVVFHGTPNWQRFAETWAQILAAREGLEVVPGSVRVELKHRDGASSTAGTEKEEIKG
jgi:hypothetical protein